MKGSLIIETILEILQGGAEAAANILDIMTSGYSASQRKIGRTLKYGTPQFRSDWAETFRDRQKFYGLLNYLKKQGLIEPKKRGAKSFWKMTPKGALKLETLRERNFYSRERARYSKGGDDASVKIIAYDIPAAESPKKRFWLRCALHNLGFTLLQKSVWVGKKKIPEEFLSDLHERKMLSYIHIFEVAKRGTLKEVT